MARIVWDEDSKRLYETGVDRGVLYPRVSGEYSTGVPWNGLTAVSESPSGAEATDLYADNIKYLSMRSAETFSCTIEAYTYPKEFEACDGTASIATGVTIGQQDRTPFGFCYRTLIGNDTEGQGHGYKIHIIYGCTASPSERSYQTVNDSPEAITFSWEVNTTPINVTGHKPTACLIIDSTLVDSEKLTKLENALYGDSSGDGPKLLTPDEVIAIIGAGVGG